MTVMDYIAEKKDQNTTMCAAILYPDGEIVECVKGHMTTLIESLGSDIWDEIPKEESPLFWLTAYTGAVLIDYENQIYSENLAKEQEEALSKLYEAEVLMKHPCNIHFGNRVLGIERKIDT